MPDYYCWIPSVRLSELFQKKITLDCGNRKAESYSRKSDFFASTLAGLTCARVTLKNCQKNRENNNHFSKVFKTLGKDYFQSPENSSSHQDESSSQGLSLNGSQHGNCSTEYDTPAGT